MLVEHTLTFVARCPANDNPDVYEMTFRLDRFVQVEELMDLADDYGGSRIWQEDLTQELADHMRCEVESKGIHSGVKTRVVCYARPRKRNNKDDAKKSKQ